MSNYSYTNTKQTPSGWNANEPNNFNYSVEQLITAIERREIASITFVDPYGYLQSLHAPYIERDEHAKPVAIYGNVKDDMRIPSFAKIDIQNLGHFIAIRDSNFQYGFSTNAKLSREHLKETQFSGRDCSAAAFPNFLALPHGKTPPEGELDMSKVEEIRQNLSPVAAAIVEGILLAMPADHSEDAQKVGEKIFDAGMEATTISPMLSQGQTVLPAPQAVFSHVNTLPQEATVLINTFKLQTPSQPHLAHVQQQQQTPLSIPLQVQDGSVLLPQIDSNQKLLVIQSSVDNSVSSDKTSHAKRSLFNIAGLVNFENNSVSDLVLPTWSNSFLQLLKLPTKERPMAYSSMVESSIRQKKEKPDPMNLYNSFDITCVDDTLSSKLLNTNYSSERMEPLIQMKNSSHQLEVRTFGPQSKSPEQIKAIIEQKKLLQSEKEIDVPEEKRSQANTKVLLFNIGNTEDIVTTCINFYTIKAVELNLAAMANKSPLILQLVNHIRDTILVNKKYIDKYYHQMQWLPCMLSTSLQHILSAFADFSREFTLTLALRAEMSDEVLRSTLSSGNFEHLNETVRAATSVSLAIKQANFAQKALSASQHCPSFWKEDGFTQGDTKGGLNPKSDAGDTREKKRPVSASGEKQNRSSRFQTNPRIPQQYQRKPEEQCGMFYLHDTNIAPGSVFPYHLKTGSGLLQKPLCADFCCQGKKCKNRPCKFAHVIKYSQLNQNEFDTICKHFSDKKVGWLSDGMLKMTNNLSLKLEYNHLRGDENGPFSQQNEG